MGIKIKKVAEAVKKNGIKILTHAPAGTGKTVLAATAMEPTLIISAESGLLSLDNDALKEQNPHFAPEMCDVVEIESIEDLEEVYGMLAEQVDDPQWSWIALDSITEIAEQVLSAELEENKDPRKAYGNLSNRVNNLLRMFRDLPNYNIYMSCKQTPVKDEYSGLTIYSPMMPGAKLGNAIPYLFDEVLCLRVDRDEDGEDIRYLQTSRDVQYEAKDRSGKLDKVEAPSLKRIAEKIRGTYVESATIPEKAEKPEKPEEAEQEEVDVETDQQNQAMEEVSKEVESEDKPLKRKEYYWHDESDSGVIAETVEQREECLNAGCEKIGKMLFDKRMKQVAEAEEKAKETESAKSDADSGEVTDEFKASLMEVDHQDLVGLAIKLDEEIELETAEEVSSEMLVEWITESSMDEIREACKEIGLA